MTIKTTLIAPFASRATQQARSAVKPRPEVSVEQALNARLTVYSKGVGQAENPKRIGLFGGNRRPANYSPPSPCLLRVLPFQSRDPYLQRLYRDSPRKHAQLEDW